MIFDSQLYDPFPSYPGLTFILLSFIVSDLIKFIFDSGFLNCSILTSISFSNLLLLFFNKELNLPQENVLSKG